MVQSINQVLIFAAGRGERMRPLTDATPKPLAKIHGITMLDRTIENVEKIPQIKTIIINTYYLSDIIEDHIQSLSNPKIILSKEVEKLETGGGLLNAMDLLDATKPILLINSDVIWQGEEVLQSMVDRFEESMDMLLGVKPLDQFPGYYGKGDFHLDGNSGDISWPNNHHRPNCVFTGIQIINPRILKDCPEPPFSMNHFFKKADQGHGGLKDVKGLQLGGKFYHVGTVDDIKLAEKVMSSYTNPSK